MDRIRSIDVFFYGLFMDQELLRGKGLEPKNPRVGRVEKYQLAIGNRATLVPNVGSAAYGVVFALTHNELERLYSDESVNMYRPEAVVALLDDGNSVAALCFNLPVAPALGEQNPAYAARLKNLAKLIGLPADYVASIA